MTTRLTISLNDDLHAHIERIARLQGRPKAKVIIELLEPLKPTMGHIANGLEAVKALQEGLPDSVRAQLQAKAQHALEKQAQGQVDLGDLVDAIRGGAKK